MATRISTAARNAAADAIGNLADAGAGAGKIRVYTGTQPAGPDTTTADTLLAEFTLSDPAFGAVATGVKSLSGTPKSTTGLAAGTAGWFRLVDSNAGGGAAGILDGSVGTSGADLVLNTTTISVGVTIQITSGTVTMPAS